MRVPGLADEADCSAKVDESSKYWALKHWPVLSGSGLLVSSSPPGGMLEPEYALCRF